MEVTGAWSREEAEAFLTSDAGTVPIRLACHTPDGELWMLSLWYQYRDGDLLCATGADADVVRYLRADPSVAFEVSVEEPPYVGVRGNGTASVEPDPEKTLLRDLLDRYLGGTDSSLAERLLADDREEVVLRIDAARFHSWDFTDRMADAVADGGTSLE
ncbi:pyridoxamine 5'-phosphate oxidase family protein [Halorarius halobius]|uniref:pyridoxamine 5'-phosphate oxidase family protein n=1 Tax=Halorarius halobius TaxID=2962671 RepID=UPI0020CBA638|nr:pyridoxamine 5'-phosphate oxidase family protein [Halorarius halobius]